MQREIKFRVWDLAVGAMKVVDSIHFNTDGTISGIGFAYPAKKGWIKEYRQGGDDLELMQFTGLKDKNGKEIYEGDILRQRVGNEFGSKQEMVGVMEWHPDGQWAIRYETDSPVHFAGDCGKPEVIGDIYENPELLTTN